jgi:FkbM family methyltransferase
MLSTSRYTVADLARYGVSMVVDVRDPAISKPILALGEYERGVTRALMSFVKEDTRFLDVGANIGYFSLLVGRRCPQGCVWSFEPDPGNFRLLRTNVVMNDLEAVISAHGLAVSDRNERLYLSDLGHGSNIGARFTARDEQTLKERCAAGAAETLVVEAVAIDSFLAEERVDLVKVDVEGFEPSVFRGMEETMRRNSPVIFAEFAPGTIRHISRSDPAELLELVDSLGYRVRVVSDGCDIVECDGRTGSVMAYFEDRVTHHLNLIMQKG